MQTQLLIAGRLVTGEGNAEAVLDSATGAQIDDRARASAAQVQAAGRGGREVPSQDGPHLAQGTRHVVAERSPTGSRPTRKAMRRSSRAIPANR